MNRVIPLFVTILFLLGVFVVPAGVMKTQEPSVSPEATLEEKTEHSWLPYDQEVRVAVYHEPNDTTPSYAFGWMDNYTSEFYDFLSSSEILFDLLTFQDILDHKLLTVNYDVFVLVDNCPRENITNLVTEFWLGGGGILSFDDGAAYLGYAGIFPRETQGVDHGYETYWMYRSNTVAKISTRHPVTKSYSLDDQVDVDDTYPRPQYNKTALDTTSIASNIVYLAMDESNSNWYQALAVDPSDRGGRVVQFGVDMHPWPADWEDMILDSIEWLCPTPKGRIAFDLSHKPAFGVDAWDDLSNNPGELVLFRDLLVNHTYTFDKLYPKSSGNLTLDRLDDYEILVLEMPLIDFTASEISVVQAYISSGGSLIANGGDPLNAPNEVTRMNTLTDYAGIYINPDQGNMTSTPTEIDAIEHVTLEGCSSLHMAHRGYVNISGAANALWGIDPDISVASTTYGQGRIILSANSHWIKDSEIIDSDNARFVLNAANWLSASKASVLIHTSGDFMIDANYNYYTSPAVTALRTLGLKFHLTEYLPFFNRSLTAGDWELVILDENIVSAILYYDEIRDYLESGGKMIVRTWGTDWTNEFGTYLGYEANGSHRSTPPTVHFWDTYDAIFHVPMPIRSDNISTSNNYFGIDYHFLNPLENGTAIAGISETSTPFEAAIIRSTDVPVITNAFSISTYFDDTDDSTYGDGYEIFLNEIADLMKPTIDHPADMTVEYGDSGAGITWTPHSDRPWEYQILNGTFPFNMITNGTWDGGSIFFSLDGYGLGCYSFVISATDSAYRSALDWVQVNVSDTTYPSFVDAPDNLEYQEGTAEHWFNWSFTELLPDSYWIIIDNVTVESSEWDGSEISYDVGGYLEGVYNVTAVVNDTSAHVSSSTVFLNVTVPVTTSSTTTTTTTTDTTITDTNTGTTSPPPEDGDMTLLIIIAVAGLVIVVVVIVRLRKRKS